MNNVDNGEYYIVALMVMGEVKHETVYASSAQEAREIAQGRFPVRPNDQGQAYKLVRD